VATHRRGPGAIFCGLRAEEPGWRRGLETFRVSHGGGQAQNLVNGTGLKLSSLRWGSLGHKRRRGSRGARTGISGDGAGEVLICARSLTPMAAVATRGSWWADTRHINGRGSSKHSQVVSREIAEMNVLGADAFKIGLGSLRSSNCGEFGNQVVLARLIQRLELRWVGMSQVVEVERIRYNTLQAFTCDCPRSIGG
jgi:hypothetical protein